MVKDILKKVKKASWDKLLQWFRRTFILKNRDFTIISNNCWGGESINDMVFHILPQQLV